MKRTFTLLFLLSLYNFLFSQVDCNSAIEISCGQTLEGNNITSCYNFYNGPYCHSNDANYTGKERIYKIKTSKTTTVSFTLNNPSADLDIFLTSSCSPTACITSSYSPGAGTSEFISATVDSGVYYLIVDGWSGAAGNYLLTYTCSDNPGILDCSTASTLNCNQPIIGTTSDGASNVVGPYCGQHCNYSGKEKVYSFEVKHTGVYTVTASGLTADLDMFLLNDCSKSACVGVSGNSGSNTETITKTLTPDTYYIVLDGFKGASSPFTLSLTCPTTSPPLDCNTLVSSYYSGTGSNLRFTFKFNSNLACVFKGWKIGNNSYGNSPTINFLFQTPGTYDVCAEYLDLATNTIKTCCRKICAQLPSNCGQIIQHQFVNGKFVLNLEGNSTQYTNVTWRNDTDNIAIDPTNMAADCRTKVISVTYFNTQSQCWTVCCKAINFCPPTSCQTNILSTYNPLDKSFNFSFNDPSASNIKWFFDATNTIIPNGKFVLPAGWVCADKVVSISYYDNASKCWRICCKKINLCPPVDCQTAIQYAYQSSSKKYIFTLDVPNVGSTFWKFAEGNIALPNGVFQIPTNWTCSNKTVIADYYDLSSQSWKSCSRVVYICPPSNCSDNIKFQYIASANKFTFTYDGYTNSQLIWKFEEDNLILQNGEFTLPANWTCKERTLQVFFFNSASQCWQVCSKNIVICPPSNCQTTIDYNFIDEANKMVFTLGVSGATNIIWKIDEDNKVLANGELVFNNSWTCSEKTITATYFDITTGCWRTCCKKINLCPAPNCGNSIDYTYNQTNNKYSFTLNNSLASDLSWRFSDGTALANGEFIIPSSFICGVKKVQVKYYIAATKSRHVCQKAIYICPPADCESSIGFSYNNSGNAITFVLQNSNAQDVVWKIVEDNVTLNNGVFNIPINWTCGERTVSAKYFDTSISCYKTCTKRVYICPPSNCEDAIKYQYLASGNKFKFTLDQANVTVAFWKIEEDNFTFNGEFVIPQNYSCGNKTVSVTYLNPSTNCYATCIKVIYLCPPSACQDKIKHTFNEGGNGVTFNFICPNNSQTCVPNNMTGWAVATCNAAPNTNLPVGVIYDIRNTNNAPKGSDWGGAITALHPENWTIDKIGQVFGITLDDANNIYLAASDIYDTQYNSDPYGSGQIFKAKPDNNFLAAPFIALPNIGGALNGIGDVVFDKRNKILFASNLEDGKIYAISNTGNVIATFDPWSADNSAAGIVSEEEQVWALGLNIENGIIKLYFPRVGGGHRSIYSISLGANGAFPSSGSEKLEFTNIMGVGKRIADIAFNANGDKMVFSERGTKFTTGAHDSKLLGYKKSGSSWAMDLQYFAGALVNDVFPGLATGPGENAAGGVDFGYTKVTSTNVEGQDEILWASTNWFRTPAGKLYYGMQGIATSGNNPSTATSNPNTFTDLIIDYDGTDDNYDQKGDLGDVEIFKCTSNSNITNISWIIEETGQQIGTGLTSNEVPVPSTCGTYTATVTYKEDGIWHICCKKVYLCNPENCSDAISHVVKNTTINLSLAAGSQEASWSSNLPITANGNNATITTPTSNGIVKVSVDYFDPAIGAYRTCKKDIVINNCTAPIAAFTYTNLNGAYQFINQSQNGTSYAWSFSGGVVVTGSVSTPNAEVVFKHSGTYNVCLTVSNECGTKTICQNINVSNENGCGFTIASNVCGNLGQELLVPVYINNFTNILAFNFTIKSANGNAVQMIGIDQFHPSLANGNYYFVEQDKIRFFWSATQGANIPNNTPAFYVKVKLNTAFTTPITLSFENDPVKIECFNGNQQTVPLNIKSGSVCMNTSVGVSGMITTPENNALQNVMIKLNNADNTMNNSNGSYNLNNLFMGSSYAVKPYKNTNPQNGINGLDIVKLQKHLLQIEQLISPYKIIAADVNNDKTINALDVVNLQKLILHMISEFPNNTSWRFVPKSYTFTSTDVLNTAFPESIIYQPINNMMSAQDFYAIKIGDLNGSADQSSSLGNIDNVRNTLDTATMILGSQYILGDDIIVPVRMKGFENLVSFENSITWDSNIFEFNKVSDISLVNLSESNFGKTYVKDGKLLLSWFDAKTTGVTMAESDILFNLHFKKKTTLNGNSLIKFSSQPLLAAAYNSALEPLVYQGSHAEIIQVSPISVASEVVPVSCFGGSNGEININCTFGSSDFKYKWNTGDTTASISQKTVGNYLITISDNKTGEVVIIEKEIMSPAEIKISLNQTIEDNKINVEASVIGGIAPYTYQWSHGTTASILMNALPGAYTVNINDANGCIARAEVTVSDITSSKNLSEYSLRVYPNPANDYIYVYFDGEKCNYQWQLIDNVGRIISSGKNETCDVNTIDVSSILPGLYTLKFKNESGNITKPIIIID